MVDTARATRVEEICLGKAKVIDIDDDTQMMMQLQSLYPKGATFLFIHARRQDSASVSAVAKNVFLSAYW